MADDSTNSASLIHQAPQHNARGWNRMYYHSPAKYDIPAARHASQSDHQQPALDHGDSPTPQVTSPYTSPSTPDGAVKKSPQQYTEEELKKLESFICSQPPGTITQASWASFALQVRQSRFLLFCVTTKYRANRTRVAQ